MLSFGFLQRHVFRSIARIGALRTHATIHRFKEGPSLADFIAKAEGQSLAVDPNDPTAHYNGSIPYLNQGDFVTKGSVYFETYGCQMNVSDTEVVWSVMQKAGYTRAPSLDKASVIFLVTCAVRDNAEQRVWGRLGYMHMFKKNNPKVKIGVLGCMAERLKTKILEKDKYVDVICGPDAYRDLPNLLGHVSETGQAGVNVMLSLEETYADITPVRLDTANISAFVSIMRGCDNMCSYCIVPFTRGKERSRDVESIIEEVKKLSDEGVKEITLLGQNVNSYRDLSQGNFESAADDLTPGFKTIYKKREGGLRFADLLDRVSNVNPEIRIRFTSPHPKDFPEELLHLINERTNICKSIHLPAQSGSTTVLERMRRGYSREAYLELVARIREIIPRVALSSDFISGFCGETEEEHQDTLSLIKAVNYDMAFMYAYSLREKTHAHRHYKDDVDPLVKKRRLNEVIELYRMMSKAKNQQFLGTRQLVLVEGSPEKNDTQLIGRIEANKKVAFPKVAVPSSSNPTPSIPSVGDYVEVVVNESQTSSYLQGQPLKVTTLKQFMQGPFPKMYSPGLGIQSPPNTAFPAQGEMN